MCPGDARGPGGGQAGEQPRLSRRLLNPAWERRGHWGAAGRALPGLCPAAAAAGAFPQDAPGTSVSRRLRRLPGQSPKRTFVILRNSAQMRPKHLLNNPSSRVGCGPVPAPVSADLVISVLPGYPVLPCILPGQVAKPHGTRREQISPLVAEQRLTGGERNAKILLIKI